MIPPFAIFDPRLTGEWENASLGWGYYLINERPLVGRFGTRKTLHDYIPDYSHPMFYRQSDGTRIAAGAFDGTDGMSVPIPLQRFMPKDGSHAAFPHDFIYRTGGAFFRYPGETTWTFRQVTRPKADRLLRASAENDRSLNITPRRAFWVWAGVCVARPFTRGIFHTWQPGDDTPVWPIEERPGVDDYAGHGYGGGG